MIDLATTLFSTLMVVYVVYRAIKMDRQRPWFETQSMYDQEQARQRHQAPERPRRIAGIVVSGRRRTTGV